MCSISGFVAEKPLNTYTATRLATALLFYGRDRGKQSAGVWADGRLLKKAIDPADLAETPEFFTDLFPPSTPIKMALIHTRQPTCGERGDDQAQPFVGPDRVGDAPVVAIHNGMISNHEELQKRWGIEMPSGVDSELVTSFVRKFGPFKLPRFIRSMNGSAAIAVYWRGSVYLMRESNPIETFTVKLRDDSRVTVFGSTQHLIQRAIQYVWLMDCYVGTTSLKERQLHILDGKGPDKLGVPITYHRPAQSRVYRAGYGGYQGYNQEDWEYDNYPNKLPEKQTEAVKHLATCTCSKCSKHPTDCLCFGCVPNHAKYMRLKNERDQKARDALKVETTQRKRLPSYLGTKETRAKRRKEEKALEIQIRYRVALQKTRNGIMRGQPLADTERHAYECLCPACRRNEVWRSSYNQAKLRAWHPKDCRCWSCMPNMAQWFESRKGRHPEGCFCIPCEINPKRKGGDSKNA